MGITSNRAFAKPPSKIALLLWTTPHVEWQERFYVASPPVKGPQACIIEMGDRNGVRYLRDAVVIIPTKAPYRTVGSPKRLRVALAISSTANRAHIKELRENESFMSEVPETINQKPFRTPLDGDVEQVLKRSLLEIKSIEPGQQQTPKRLLSLQEDLEQILLALSLRKWSPWIVGKDRALQAAHLRDPFLLIQEWSKMRQLTWEQRWSHLNRHLERRLRKAKRDDEIELQAKSFASRCRRLGLCP
jgi:hypothetical protein